MPDIEIRLNNLAQLYDSLDPAPFHEKSLDRDAEAYLLDCAGEHPAGTSLRLMVHGPENLRSHVTQIANAIHSHFSLAHRQVERRWRGHVRLARIVVVAGLFVLTLSLLLRRLLTELPFPGAGLISEGLLILGWVALWRPIEQAMFDRFDHRHKTALLESLARIPVEFNPIS